MENGKLRIDPAKAKVRCVKDGENFVAYIYEGTVDGCLAKYWCLGKTREGALKKLAIAIFDDLIFEEEQYESLREESNGSLPELDVSPSPRSRRRKKGKGRKRRV